MRTIRVPWLSLMLALVLAFAGSVMVFSKASAQPAGQASALSPAAKLAIANLAKDSKKLGGKPPSAYFDRTALRSATGAVAVNGIVEILPGTNITTPGAIKFVRVTGNATFAGGASNYTLWFAVDDVCAASGVGYTNRQYGNTTQQENSTIDFVMPVSPGVHTFRLCASGAAGVNAYSRTLVLETIAKGPTGGNALAKLAPKSVPDRDNNPVTPR